MYLTPHLAFVVVSYQLSTFVLDKSTNCTFVIESFYETACSMDVLSSYESSDEVQFQDEATLRQLDYLYRRPTALHPM